MSRVEGLRAIDRVYFADELTDRGVTIRWMRWRPLKRNFLFGTYIDNEMIDISGYAKPAASLVATFEQSSIFSDAELTSAVTRDDARDRSDAQPAGACGDDGVIIGIETNVSPRQRPQRLDDLRRAARRVLVQVQP